MSNEESGKLEMEAEKKRQEKLKVEKALQDDLDARAETAQAAAIQQGADAKHLPSAGDAPEKLPFSDIDVFIQSLEDNTDSLLLRAHELSAQLVRQDNRAKIDSMISWLDNVKFFLRAGLPEEIKKQNAIDPSRVLENLRPGLTEIDKGLTAASETIAAWERAGERGEKRAQAPVGNEALPREDLPSAEVVNPEEAEAYLQSVYARLNLLKKRTITVRDLVRGRGGFIKTEFVLQEIAVTTKWLDDKTKKLTPSKKIDWVNAFKKAAESVLDGLDAHVVKVEEEAKGFL